MELLLRLLNTRLNMTRLQIILMNIFMMLLVWLREQLRSHLILETAKLDLNSKWSSHSFKLLRSLIVRNKDLASLIKKPTLTNAECNSCSSRVGLLICSGLKNKPLLPNFYSWDISFYTVCLTILYTPVESYVVKLP